MRNETNIEIRENLKYIYSVVNSIINDYEAHKEELSDGQKDNFMAEAMLKLGEISSILQIDIHNLDMLFSINNIDENTDRRQVW